MLNLNALERAVSLSRFYTLKAPGRFGRFSNRVLGPQASAEDREKLRAELTKIFDSIVVATRASYALQVATGQQDTPENFGRLDALNHIGNRLFYDLGQGFFARKSFGEKARTDQKAKKQGQRRAFAHNNSLEFRAS